eukprot:1024425-Prymnesium_polylepis.1
MGCTVMKCESRAATQARAQTQAHGQTAPRLLMMERAQRNGNTPSICWMLPALLLVLPPARAENVSQSDTFLLRFRGHDDAARQSGCRISVRC